MITKAIETAGFYLRMSSTKQKDSPDRQRGIVLPFADANAYEIVEEYLDDGISGLKTTERKAFQRLIKDAKAGKFDVVLCECVDRFGRLDSVQSGEWVVQLQEAGVKLVTVKEGVIDFNSFTGRITYALHTELGNEWLRGHAHKTLSGKLNAIKAGRWVFADPPFGCVRVFRDETGQVMRKVYYGERFTKPRTWSCTLDISDREDFEIVQWLFNEYATTATSVRGLRVDLNRRGVPSPKGKVWYESTIHKILKNVAYLGCLQIGRYASGELYRIGKDGGIEDGSKSTEKRETSPLIVEDAFPAIIDRATFEIVQGRLASRKIKRVVENGYLLQRVIRCGHCGHYLIGGKKLPSSPRKYFCSSRSLQFSDCPNYQIDAKLIESYLVGIIQGFLSEKSIQARRKKLMEKQKARQGKKSFKGPPLKRRLSVLETKIKKGAETMLLASKADIADLSQTMAEWREQRDYLKSQLAEIEGSDETNVSVDDAIAKLRNLRKAMDDASKPKFREILQRILSHVEIFWEPRHPDNGMSYQMFKVARGLAVFCDGIHAEPIEFGRPELGCLDPVENVAVAVWKIFNGTTPVSARDVADQMGRANTGTTFNNLAKAENRGLLGSCVIDCPTGGTQKGWFLTNDSFFARCYVS